MNTKQKRITFTIAGLFTLLNACSSEIFTDQVSYQGKTDAVVLSDANADNLAFRITESIQYILTLQAPLAKYYYESYDSSTYSNLYELGPTTRNSGLDDCYPDGANDCGIYSYPAVSLDGYSGSYQIQTDKEYFSFESEVTFNDHLEQLFTNVNPYYRFSGDLSSSGKYYFPSQNFIQCHDNSSVDSSPKDDQYDACIKLSFDALTHKRISTLTLADLTQTSISELHYGTGYVDVNYEDFALSRTQSSASAFANIEIKNVDKESYLKFENIKLSWVLSNGKYTSVKIEGKLYDSELGYVTLSTNSPLALNTDTGLPESGSILAEGSDKKLLIGGGATSVSLSIGTDPVGGNTDSTNTIAWAELERTVRGL